MRHQTLLLRNFRIQFQKFQDLITFIFIYFFSNTYPPKWNTFLIKCREHSTAQTWVLNLPAPFISECPFKIKINFNFYFHTFCDVSGFMKTSAMFGKDYNMSLDSTLEFSQRMSKTNFYHYP